jgi:hypothetical protein
VTENELGRALLNLDVGPPPAPDPRALARRLVDRDRRRVRWVAGMAGFFWVLTAAGIVCWYPFYVMYIAPRLRSYGAGRAKLAQDWDAWALLGEWAAGWMTACVISLLLAGASTVWLVLLSRRATLRQINASLAEICEQLKRVPPAPAP